MSCFVCEVLAKYKRVKCFKLSKTENIIKNLFNRNIVLKVKLNVNDILENSFVINFLIFDRMDSAQTVLICKY